MSKSIPLSRGKFAIVDDADYEWLSQYKWHFATVGYAASIINGKSVYMHRLLLTPPAKHYVDHIDRNRLNNARSNLRIVTPTQSLMNQSKRKNVTSSFRGVAFIQGKWSARIKVNGQEIPIGRFRTQKAAAEAYNQAAVQHFGEYAALNDLSILPDKVDLPLGSRKKTSKYNGVKQMWPRNKWQARIMVDRVQHHLGTFATELEAAQAYDNFIRERGIDRPLNFP